MLRRALAPLLVVVLVAAAPALAQGASPAEAARALRERLGREGTRAELAGLVRMPVFLGEARVGLLSMRTDLVTREDGPVYRIVDRLDLELPGVGAVHLGVQADLRPDLSAVEVVLETEEPRGPLAVSRQRVALRREGDRWVRRVASGEAPAIEGPVAADLPPDVLVLTPPLGVGERLARLVPAELGARLSAAGLDLESGERARWQVSVDDRRSVEGREAPDAAPAGPGPLLPRAVTLDALLVRRDECAARLAVLREPGPAGLPLRLVREEPAGRLVAQDARLVLDPGAPPPPPVACVLDLLRAAARGDVAAVRARLDLDALWTASGGADLALRATFDDVLARRLTDGTVLRDRGLLFAAIAAAPADFAVQAEGELRARVRLRADPSDGPAFVVARGADGAWRVVDLPRSR